MSELRSRVKSSLSCSQTLTMPLMRHSGTKAGRRREVFSDATGVAQVEMPTNAKATGVYGIAGDKRSKMVRGINILKLTNGKTVKVMNK